MTTNIHISTSISAWLSDAGTDPQGTVELYYQRQHAYHYLGRFIKTRLLSLRNELDGAATPYIQVSFSMKDVTLPIPRVTLQDEATARYTQFRLITRSGGKPLSLSFQGKITNASISEDITLIDMTIFNN